MRPGATQLTVMVGARATARQRVRWISAALLDAYAMELPLEGAAHVRVEDAVPDLDRELVELGERNADVPGGVVDENVQPPEIARGRAHGVVDGGGIGLIELDGAGPAAKLLDALRSPQGAVTISDVPDGDVASCPG
jgi:hypothetical protein